ncbi:MAG: alpha/beta fold hydrolase [Acidovorax sp.]
MTDSVLPESARRLAARALLFTTPLGAGRIVWRAWGEPSGQPPLVLLHGGSGSWTHWLRNIDALLAEGRQLWIPDLPGFGDSSVLPEGSDADAMIAPLHAGLHTLFHGQPCDLVGFSFGGLTAGLLAAAFPQAVRRLVLVGAPAMGVAPQRQFRLKGWRHLHSPEAQAAVHRYNLAELMLSDAALIDGDTLALHAHNVARDRLPRRRLAHTDILARSLPQTRCPVHAIYGAQDALYKSWIGALDGAFRAALGDRFQGLEMVPGCGHWVQYEQPGAFHEALRRALFDAKSASRPIG